MLKLYINKYCETFITFLGSWERSKCTERNSCRYLFFVLKPKIKGSSHYHLLTVPQLPENFTDKSPPRQKKIGNLWNRSNVNLHESFKFENGAFDKLKFTPFKFP